MIKIYFLFIVLLSNILFAKDLHPTKVFKANGAALDIQYNDGKIYVATDTSGVDIIDFKSGKVIQSIKVPQIEDFMGDLVDVKIYSIDILKGKILFVNESTKGKREIQIYDNSLKKIIKQSDGLIIAKAKFVDEHNIVFSTLGNEFYLYNLITKKIVYKIDVKAKDSEFNSKFSDFTLNNTKTKAVVADESGDLKIIDIKSGEIIQLLAGQNLDNVFKVDWQKDFIITAGQDQKTVVYNLKNNSSYFKKTNFLIYGAALNKSATLGGYSCDEQNNVKIFDISIKQNLFKLLDNKMTLTSILFIDDKRLFVTTDSPIFNFYNLDAK